MTLLETLVTLAIMAMTAVLAFPVLENVIDGLAFRHVADLTVRALTDARSVAIARQQAVPAALPAQVVRQVSITIAGTSPILFFADGSSSGGTLLIRRGRRQTRLTIDPVTGATMPGGR